MMYYKNFLEHFISNGYLYQATNIELLGQVMSSQKITAYVGFDCTAKSLHVGNLMQIMILRLLQQYGHRAIVLIGGGTSKIGDPSFKSTARNMLNDSEISENIKGIKKSLSKFLKFNSNDQDSAIILNNADWLDRISYLDFLRNYGRLVSVNKMLSMDSIKSRLQNSLSLTFLEFNYSLLQSYDFFYLNKNYDCVLQFGGSDQWGNIVTGIDFIKKITSKTIFGVTTPLLVTANGAKMGKTANGAVWLNEDMLSCYEYYQYWRNVHDLDVIKFAKLYADFDLVSFKEFEYLAQVDINAAKKQLAYRLTAICHGQCAADIAHTTSIDIFEKKIYNTNSVSLSIDNLIIIKGIDIRDLLCDLFHLVSSRTEVKRLIRRNTIKINNIIVKNENMIVDIRCFSDNVMELSIGKRKYVRIILCDSK